VFANFYWATGQFFWGEDSPGMKSFIAIYEKYGKDSAPPNFYILSSYAQGVIELEAAARAIKAGPLTRESYLAALKTIDNYDVGGLGQPISLKAFPYVPSVKSRILKPKLAERTWEVVGGYAVPKGAQI
jgi:hypothetical protein